MRSILPALWAVLVLSVPGCTFDRSGLGASPVSPGDGPRSELPLPADLSPAHDWLHDSQRTDAPSPHDLPAPHDVQQPRDAPVPKDTAPPPPDGPTYLVSEDFTTGWGDVSPETGSWNNDTTAGTVTQSSQSTNGRFAYAALPTNDYIAETEVKILGDYGLSGISEGAGLAVRVNPQLSYVSYPPDQYACVVSSDWSEFGVWECSNSNQTCTIRSSTSIAFNWSTVYRIRATVIGNQITCELPDQGKTVQLTDSTHASGGVALSTFYASATFYSLKVWMP